MSGEMVNLLETAFPGTPGLLGSVGMVAVSVYVPALSITTRPKLAVPACQEASIKKSEKQGPPASAIFQKTWMRCEFTGQGPPPAAMPVRMPSRGRPLRVRLQGPVRLANGQRSREEGRDLPRPLPTKGRLSTPIEAPRSANFSPHGLIRGWI